MSNQHPITRERRDLLGALANILVVALVLYAFGRPEGPVGQKVTAWWGARRIRTLLESDWPSVASGARLDSVRTAPVAVVEFADYECPFCRQQRKSLASIVGARPDDGVVFRHLPLPIHAHADGAARTAICAERQGRFREMHERLLGTDGWLADTNWTREAKAVGIADIPAFVACRTSEETSGTIAADVRMAKALGINGTPTFVGRTALHIGVINDSAFAALAGDRR